MVKNHDYLVVSDEETVAQREELLRAAKKSAMQTQSLLSELQEDERAARRLALEDFKADFSWPVFFALCGFWLFVAAIIHLVRN